MVSAHQNLGPIAGDVSGDKVQAYGKMGAPIDVGPYLIATPDNDDGTADRFFGDYASTTVRDFVQTT
jgi:hypothetical protein